MLRSEQSLKSAQKGIDDLILRQKNEGGTLVELEHLKIENARLLALLSCTQEYQDFQDYIKSGQQQPKKKQSQNGSAGEEWIPEEAFQIAYDFRARFGSELTNAAISKLLAELNKIWKERERKQMVSIRHNCNLEIMALRKQLAAASSVKEQTTKKAFERILKELKSAHREIQKQASQGWISLQQDNEESEEYKEKVLREGIKWAKGIMNEKIIKTNEKVSDFEQKFEKMPEKPRSTKKFLFETFKTFIADLDAEIQNLK